MRLPSRFLAGWGEVRLGMLWLFRSLCRMPGLRNPYQALLIRLIKQTGLFDRTNYLDLNSDVAHDGMTPLRHYVVYGDREGRWPMPLFDPHYYRSRVKGKTRNVNALLHYAYVGRHRYASPSAWFDMRHYLSLNKDVARSGLDPLLHYIQRGGLEGRSPNPQFDGAYYLQKYPDVRDVGLNPLLHYIRVGQREGRCSRNLDNDAMDETGTTEPFAAPKLPTAADWKELEARIAVIGADEAPLVDVIVPVYRSHTLTWLCLASVLSARNTTPFQLIVINDAGPEPELNADLLEMSRRGWITLIENKTNHGFVRTVNQGIAVHPDRDVVLLNSDTEVFPGWLDRLRRAGYRTEKVASVTPLSNNATICSYPRFLNNNPYPLEIDYHTLDRLTSQVNANVTAAAPTGVGYCMYIRRAAIEQLGIFNEKAYGKGYGEENGWCQRAIANGWVNLITADTFVRHFGSSSFLGETPKRLSYAMDILAKRHPTYESQVRQFVISDPLSRARQRLDWARLKQQVKTHNTLLVCHNRNGGAERHLQEDAVRLREEGQGVFYMRPVRNRKSHVRFQHHACRQLINLPHYRLSDTETLASVLIELGITCIHSHGLVDFEPEAELHLQQLCQKIDAELQIDIHDYKVICPRINLIDKNGVYCSEPDADGCNLCLAELGNDFDVKDIAEWRTMHHQVLRAAEKIWVPDEDVADRLLRYYPDIEFKVMPHENNLDFGLKKDIPLPLRPDEKLRIVVIGAIGKIKGYDILFACATEAQRRRLPIEFVVMGYTMNDAPLQKIGVRITGKYNDNNAQNLLAELDPRLVWLPSTWPETYSYTLSLALQQGCPVAVFDLGAMARRLRTIGGQHLIVPLQTAKHPDILLSQFINIFK